MKHIISIIINSLALALLISCNTNSGSDENTDSSKKMLLIRNLVPRLTKTMKWYLFPVEPT